MFLHNSQPHELIQQIERELDSTLDELFYSVQFSAVFYSDHREDLETNPKTWECKKILTPNEIPNACKFNIKLTREKYKETTEKCQTEYNSLSEYIKQKVQEDTLNKKDIIDTQEKLKQLRAKYCD